MNVVLIPTLNPDRRLVDYIVDLRKNGLSKILVVNDGSDAYAEEIFEKLRGLNEEQFDITILEHAKNLGKGRALKDGINYYLIHLKDKYLGSHGLITVDSDGQHLVKDVLNIDKQLQTIREGGIILGCRNFNKENVPFKSRFGNKITKFVFKMFFGKSITDTQTGLRAFSNNVLIQLIDLYGERFEYETNVLIECSNLDIPIDEISIETIYENQNKSTHFNPIVDSIKIYSLLLSQFLKYILASATSSIIDLLLFVLLCNIIPQNNGLRIYLATIGARLVSSIYNYEVNKNIVFNYKKESYRTTIEYYVLCLIIMITSGFSVNALYSFFGQHEFLIKCIVDTILFCCNYFIQQKIIFKTKGGKR